MGGKKVIQHYLNYCHWANSQVIESIVNNNIEDEKILWLISHNLNAHEVWLSRLQGRKHRYGVFEVHQAVALGAIEADLYQQTTAILENIDLEKTISYVNTTSDHLSNAVLDILLHFIDHATYHRAQIATRYREIGLEPLATNLFYWAR